jgi:protein gp37
MARRLAAIPGTVYERVEEASGIDEDPFEPAFHWDVYSREQERLTKYRRGGMHAGYTMRPRRVFVGSMGDMCFGGIAMCFNDRSKIVCPSHMYTDGVQRETAKWSERVGAAGHTVLLLTKRPDLLDLNVCWPANVHLGVSVTGNADAGRILELIDRARIWKEQGGPSFLGGKRGPGVLWASVEPLLDYNFDPSCLAGMRWVVVGFQTGSGAMRGAEIRVPEKVAVQRIMRWCAERGVPLFCKSSVEKALGGKWPQEYPTGS